MSRTMRGKKSNKKRGRTMKNKKRGRTMKNKRRGRSMKTKRRGRSMKKRRRGKKGGNVLAGVGSVIKEAVVPVLFTGAVLRKGKKGKSRKSRK